MEDFLANEFNRLAVAAGLGAVLVLSGAIVIALRYRAAKWKKLRMRGDSRAKTRELNVRNPR